MIDNVDRFRNAIQWQQIWQHAACRNLHIGHSFSCWIASFYSAVNFLDGLTDLSTRMVYSELAAYFLLTIF